MNIPKHSKFFIQIVRGNVRYSRHLLWLRLHIRNQTYNSTHSTSGSPIPTVPLKLN